MNLNETKRPTANTCSACGAALPANMPPALCPKCLLKAGLPSQAVTLPNAAPARPSRTMPQPNEQFGHYRIIRQIGQGGMGAVFEAEDMENGRRLALKIMSHTLDSHETRARFLREGRLAASINHPNSVYIFGTEEIAGMPVIAMEFVTGGTLQDRVKQKGPLPATEAVDSILQVIDGLEAAQRLGVLHRDVKPSNCFVDPDGKVKIGDFGLSINTAIRLEPTLTATGAFMGTPAFASPEQLRGDELSVRSDIYAVGVTFYYLLTGSAPFESPNLPQLLASILERQVESPTKRRRSIPEGVSQIVLRCLEKNPDKRFKDYAEMRQALLAYSSTAPTPSTLGMRLVAYWVDTFLIAMAGLMAWFCFAGFFPIENVEQDIPAPAQFMTVLSEELSSTEMPFQTILGCCLTLLYFLLLEGFWGKTLGKALCGLRVIRKDRDRPGILRALGRVLIFLGPVNLYPLVFGLPSTIMSYFLWMGLCPLWFLMLLITIRKHNGFAMLHDLLTGTRVVQRSSCPIRSPLSVATETLPSDAAKLPMIGPYQVLEKLDSADGREWLVGYDVRLLRKVWIRKMKPDDPPVSSGLRNIGRRGRLRWLNGKRLPAESWDAYEAVLGQPLVNLVRYRQSWERVRFWLVDLAEELQAAQADGSLPETLSLARVWITADNHAKLLDFIPPGLTQNQESGLRHTDLMATTPQDFLRQVAAAALEGRPVSVKNTQTPFAFPLAMHARRFLDALSNTTALADIILQLKQLLAKTAVVSRMRRIVVLAVCLLITLPLVGIIIFSIAEESIKEAIPINEIHECMALSGTLIAVFLIIYVIIPGLIAALAFRRGLLAYVMGIVFVTRTGVRASRLRVFWRNLLAWLPVFVLLISTFPLTKLWKIRIILFTDHSWLANYANYISYIAPIGWGLYLALAIVSTLLLNRSIQDRLAGTWMVPE